jgi:hypothetical protein
MFLLNLKFNHGERTNINILIEKLKPYLLHGAVILSTNFNVIASYISPSPIKHCSFCYIKDNKYYIIEISEKGFNVLTLYDFLKIKLNIYIFYYKDIEIMGKTMQYIFNYKDKKYGFFKDQEYCYKLLFDIYNDTLGNIYKNINDFIPSFKIFNKEYINSNSLITSNNFYMKCCLIDDYFIKK